MEQFDLLIIGGGHAGIEAAAISSQLGLSVGLITMNGVPIGSAPCNPAIGGVGKGQVAREIDCLGGVMGKLADSSAIQYRILNESKGYAVKSTRVQIDKEVYSEKADKLVRSLKNLKLIYGKVSKVERGADGMFHVEHSGGSASSSKVIVTSGTFLNACTHMGKVQKSGGRFNCENSRGAGDIFSFISNSGKRFKTGTPPRLNKDSINFDKLIPQSSDPETSNFHLLNKPKERFLEQKDCFIAHTNPEAMKIIRDNKEKSPIFNGQIQGVGPRYCPSIEDKAFRYPDRDSHHVFVEPESHRLTTYYPNGLSTSLPTEVQLEFLRKIEGFESVEIEIPGYAVEYDVVDTTTLDLTLQSKEVPGLYFAGQVNGTSGYEEAAGQGLIAGINASFAQMGKEPFVLPRSVSYIGVMIEDLVSSKRDEPYRLFTARSENRLFIREDNVVERMYPYRKLMGLELDLDNFLKKFHVEQTTLLKIVNETFYYPNLKTKEYFEKMGYGKINNKKISLKEVMRYSHLSPIKVLQHECERSGILFDERVIATVAISVKYEGYINRADVEFSKVGKVESMRIDLERVKKSKLISFECKARIAEISPETFGQLKKIVGLRPATLSSIAGNIY